MNEKRQQNPLLTHTFQNSVSLWLSNSPRMDSPTDRSQRVNLKKCFKSTYCGMRSLSHPVMLFIKYLLLFC